MSTPPASPADGADRPIIFSAPMIRALLDGRKTMTRRLAWRPSPYKHRDPANCVVPTPWQRVKPGARLWVRENFARNENQLSDERMDTSLVYTADGKGRALDNGTEKPWTSCIHMPRWASRLTLLVTATKIDRVQEISADDAEAEGICQFMSGPDRMYGLRVEGGYELPGLTARETFMNLWCSLHGPSAWANNTEVVALTFTVHKQNIDALPKVEAA